MNFNFQNQKTAREVKDLAKKRVLAYLSAPFVTALTSSTLKMRLPEIDVEYALNSLENEKKIMQVPVDKKSTDYATTVARGGRPKSQWKAVSKIK